MAKKIKEEKVVTKKSTNKRKKYERIVMISIGVLLFATLCFILGSGYGSMYTFDVLYNDKSTNLDGEGYIVELFNENFEYDNEDNVKTLINSTNYYTNELLRTELLDSENSYDESDFKIAYVLYEIINYYGSGIKHFTTEYLEENIEKVFNDGVNLSEEDGIYVRKFEILASDLNIICDNKICTMYGVPGGGTGFDHYSTEIVATRKDGENTIYTIKEYFVEFLRDEQGLENCTIYDSKKGNSLYKGKCPAGYEELSKKIDVNKLNTYEMTFDKEFKYVNSKKVK